MPVITGARRRFTAVAALLLGAFTGSAAAQDKIVLRFADYLPTGHFVTTQGTRFLMNRVTELTNGRVTFEYFPSGQIGKGEDLMALTRAGVVDIGFISPALTGDKLPLSAVAELPGLYSSACEGTRGYLELAKDGGILEKNEFTPNGIVFLGAATTAQYKLMTTRKEVKTGEDMSGLKVRVPGAVTALSLQSLGAVPIRMSSAEVYQAITRGTIDGMVFPFMTIKTFDLQDHMKFATVGLVLGDFVSMWAIDKKAWDKMPADIRKALRQAGLEASMNLCKYVEENDELAMKDLQKAGMRVNELSPEEKSLWIKKMESIRSKWVQDLEGRGKKSSDALKSFTEALSKK